MKAEAALVEAYEAFEAEQDAKAAEAAANKPARKRSPKPKTEDKVEVKDDQVPGSPLVEVEAPELTSTVTEDGGVVVTVAA